MRKKYVIKSTKDGGYYAGRTEVIGTVTFAAMTSSRYNAKQYISRARAEQAIAELVALQCVQPDEMKIITVTSNDMLHLRSRLCDHLLVDFKHKEIWWGAPYENDSEKSALPVPWPEMPPYIESSPNVMYGLLNGLTANGFTLVTKEYLAKKEEKRNAHKK